MKQILTLFKKDLLLEIRQQYAFYGVLLYVGATIFVLYMAIENPDNRTWIGLFWIIQLFISINAVAKSFLQESRNRMLYYHSIVSPQNFVLAKLLFNSLLMLVMSLLSMALFSLFLTYPVQRTGTFIGLVFLGGWSLSYRTSNQCIDVGCFGCFGDFAFNNLISIFVERLKTTVQIGKCENRHMSLSMVNSLKQYRRVYYIRGLIVMINQLPFKPDN
jgi:hypothetical protein